MSAAALDWNEGHVWRGAVRLPRGDHEFKCVVVDSNGNPREWEQGQNRSIPVCSPHLCTVEASTHMYLSDLDPCMLGTFGSPSSHSAQACLV